MNFFPEDTIAAISTTTGGAIAVVRISGPKAIAIVDNCFSRSLSTTKANTTLLGSFTDNNGNVIDEVVVALWKSPHSYTGEDIVEISCHGSQYITSEILMTLIRHGARLAEPGEFTKRAFLNGKMDLSQAEAVADLINSTNRATHKVAISQLRGGFSSELSQLREQLLKLTSLLELELDFSDHEELEFADRKELLTLAIQIKNHITNLENSFKTGQAIKNGIPVAIIGKTNVGKSTLLNKLLNDERAIVSDIHGTTRDTIEDTTVIHGLNFRFIDTAGLRQTDDTIEKIGIERTYKAIKQAQIVVWLFDDVPAKDETDDVISKTKDKKLIIVKNKIDNENDDYQLPDIEIGKENVVMCISAKYGNNINLLEEEIYKAADIPEITENSVVVTSARHYEALMRANQSIQRVIDSLNSGLSSELTAEELKIALQHLADITGQGIITSQETLNNIFSHFCVGK